MVVRVGLQWTSSSQANKMSKSRIFMSRKKNIDLLDDLLQTTFAWSSELGRHFASEILYQGTVAPMLENVCWY